VVGFLLLEDKAGNALVGPTGYCGHPVGRHKASNTCSFGFINDAYYFGGYSHLLLTLH
jgi:hypothetical protein